VTGVEHGRFDIFGTKSEHFYLARRLDFYVCRSPRFRVETVRILHEFFELNLDRETRADQRQDSDAQEDLAKPEP